MLGVSLRTTRRARISAAETFRLLARPTLTMTYRGETDPLKIKESTLATELSQLRRREREVTRALDEARATLRKESTLPLLEDVRIASPCSASWEEMVGDARVRLCGKCAKNVYNLSEMTRDEAEALLGTNDGNLCVRLYQRKDGTVLTTDCPTGVKAKRVRRVVALAAAALGAGSAALMAAHPTPTMGECPRAFHPEEPGAMGVAGPFPLPEQSASEPLADLTPMAGRLLPPPAKGLQGAAPRILQGAPLPTPQK
jgi:hypothetical protein